MFSVKIKHGTASSLVENTYTFSNFIGLSLAKKRKGEPRIPNLMVTTTINPTLHFGQRYGSCPFVFNITVNGKRVEVSLKEMFTIANGIPPKTRVGGIPEK